MKKFKFRLQVVLEMRENELEKLRIEMAKIIAVLNAQQDELKQMTESLDQNTQNMESLATLDEIDIQQLEAHRTYGIKLSVDIKNQERLIANTKNVLEKKQKEVLEAHKKVETLKKLKEHQKEQYYKDFLQNESKELDDIASVRFNTV